MRLASLKRGGRDGTLVVVDSAQSRCAPVPEIAPTLQAALDGWAASEPALRAAADRLEAASPAGAEPFDPAACAAPLPRAYQFLDASAYVTHVELVRKARGAAMPESFWTDPLMYQGVSDGLLGPRDPIPLGDAAWGLDLEAEIGVVVDDVPMGISPTAARGHIKLVVLLNDISLRGLIPAELVKGFGFVQSKPASSFAPLAVTPDALGARWDGGKLSGPVVCTVNGEEIGRPDAGVDMTFDFPTLIAHAARTRRLAAGTIIGSGTISNADRQAGSACLAEVRMIETLEQGAPATPFLAVGDRLRIETCEAGRSLFGAIEQTVCGPE